MAAPTYPFDIDSLVSKHPTLGNARSIELLRDKVYSAKVAGTPLDPRAVVDAGTVVKFLQGCQFSDITITDEIIESAKNRELILRNVHAAYQFGPAGIIGMMVTMADMQRRLANLEANQTLEPIRKFNSSAGDTARLRYPPSFQGGCGGLPLTKADAMGITGANASIAAATLGLPALAANAQATERKRQFLDYIGIYIDEPATGGSSSGTVSFRLV